MKKFKANSQNARILEALKDMRWHCTSEFYGDYMADPRRRMKDLQEGGYQVISRPCQQHPYHMGPSREWRLESELERPLTKEERLQKYLASKGLKVQTT